MKTIRTRLFIPLALMLATVAGFGQQTIAPFKTSQANTDLYVNMGTGSPYATIHLATVAGCKAPTAFTVVLLPGANPGDTIAGQTGVCNGLLLIDYTQAPAVTYKGNGTIYVSQGGGTAVQSINGQPGQFTFVGPAVNCVTVTCTFSGSVPVVFEGPWSSVTTYLSNQAVYYSGATYVSLQNGNINQVPGTAPSFWTLLVSGAGVPSINSLQTPFVLGTGATCTTTSGVTTCTFSAGAAGAQGTMQQAGPSGALQSTGLSNLEYAQVPRLPLKTWQQCLNNSAYQRCRLLFIGDSFDIQSFTNNGTGPLHTQNVTPNKVRALLQAKYGSGGTGITPVVAGEGGVISLDYWSISGSYSITNIIGPAQGSTASNGTVIQMSAGTVATFTRGASGNSDAIPYDTMNTVCVDNSSSSAITVRIDGGTAGTCGGTSSGSAVYRYATSTTVALANHTATFTCPSGTCYLYAADGSAGSVGVSVDNEAVGSYAAGAYGSNVTSQLPLAAMVIPQGVVFEHLTNENGQGETPSQFATYTQNVINFVQGLSSTVPPSVIITLVPIDVEATTGNPLTTYSNTLLSVVLTNNVALVNEQNRWSPPGCSNATCYVPTSGTWAIAGDAAPGIHPNDKGAQDRAQMEYDALAATAPTTTQNTLALTLTTIGTTGPATYNSVTGVLNIPNYTTACPANFCFTLTPSSLTYIPGLAATQNIPVTVAQTGAAGYSSTVTYSATGVPSGMTVTASPTTITGGSGVTTATASFPWNQTSGANNFTVSGTDGTNTHTQGETLTIGTENNNLAQGWALNDGSGSTALSTPTGNNLTMTSVTWGSTAGFPGSVAQFNGTSTFGVAANATNTNFDGTAAFSSACWLKPTSLTPGDQYFLDTLNPGATGGWWGMEIYGTGAGAPANGSVHATMTDGTTTIGAVSTAAVVGTSSPSLVGFTYAGTKAATGFVVYVNGVAVTTTTVGTSMSGSAASGSPMTIGQLGALSAAYFGGALGYCRNASRLWTSGEWAAMYAAGPQ